MSETPSFIHLEGLLYETFEFSYRRGHETTTSPRRPDETNELGVKALLVDSEESELVSVLPEVRFPAGCTPRRPSVGIADLRVSLPLHAHARALELRVDERTIFRKAIAPGTPGKLDFTDVEVEGDQLSFGLSGKRNDDSETQIFLRVKGKRLPLKVAVAKTTTADLAPYSGLGSAQLVAAHSVGFRTTESESPAFALPKSRARGCILAPRHDAEIAAGAALSLAGTVYCRSGRRLDWKTCGARWHVDGKPVDDARSISRCVPLPPGEHSIELVADESGEIVVLHSVTIRVKERTEAQLEYDRLLEEYLKAKRSAASG